MREVIPVNEHCILREAGMPACILIFLCVPGPSVSSWRHPDPGQHSPGPCLGALGVAEPTGWHCDPASCSATLFCVGTGGDHSPGRYKSGSRAAVGQLHPV